MTSYTKYLPILLSILATNESSTALITTAPTNKHWRYSIAKLQQPRPSSCWSRAVDSSANTVLYQAKDNDRARMEKSWENMMGEGKFYFYGVLMCGLDFVHILCIVSFLINCQNYIPLIHTCV